MHGGRDGSPPKWTPDMGIEALPEKLRSYFEHHPRSMDEFLETRKAAEIQHKNWDKFKKKYALADAWSNAHVSTMDGFLEREGTPEESDFKGVNEEKLEFKSPGHASSLIKKISYSFGATLVGVAVVTPDIELEPDKPIDIGVDKFCKKCKICAEQCPYSRKNNWIHTIAREENPRDPTGITSSAMLAMQKGLKVLSQSILNKTLDFIDGQ